MMREPLLPVTKNRTGIAGTFLTFEKTIAYDVE